MGNPQVERRESKHGRYATNVDVKALTRKTFSRFVKDDLLLPNGIVTKLKPWLKNYLVCMAYCEDMPMGIELLCEYGKIYDYDYQNSNIHFNYEMLDLCFVIAELLRESKRETEYKAWVKETIPLVCKPYIKYKGLEYYLKLLENPDKAIAAPILVGAPDPLNEPGLHSTSIIKKTSYEVTPFSTSCTVPQLIDKQARVECFNAIKKLKSKLASGNCTGKELEEINQINRYLSAPEHATLFKIDNAPYARFKMGTDRLFKVQIPHIPYPKVIFERHYAYSQRNGGAMLDFKKKYLKKIHECVPEVWIARHAIQAKEKLSLNILEGTLGYSVEFLFAPQNENNVTYAGLKEDATDIRTFLIEMWQKGVWGSGLDEAMSFPSLPDMQSIISKGIEYYKNYTNKDIRNRVIDELVDYGTAIKRVEIYTKHYEKVFLNLLEKLESKK